jgi:hypothetical protein
MFRFLPRKRLSMAHIGIMNFFMFVWLFDRWLLIPLLKLTAHCDKFAVSILPQNVCQPTEINGGTWLTVKSDFPRSNLITA